MTCDRSVVFVGTPVYSTTKAERHDITEILLKAKLNTITLTLLQINCEFDSRTENTQHWKKEVTFLYHFSVEITFLLAERPLPGLTIIQLWSTNFVLWVHVNLPAGAFFSRFWGSLPSLPSTFRLWKKSSTIKSWPTFCDQYFWKFPIWNSRSEEKRREIRMVKVNVIFNDIRLLICLTPLQVNWVMVIN